MLALLLTVTLLAPQDPVPTPPALTAAEFRTLHAQLVPTAPEPWQTIPWRLQLVAAAAEANADGKRLFVWSMNGHPLGCT